MSQGELEPDARDSKRLRSRRMFVALVLIAVAPLVGSYLLFFAVRVEGPWGTSNQGRLLDPLVAVTALRAVDAQTGAGASLAGRWWLLLVAESGCGADCVAAVKQLRSVHILLNKDAQRVRRGIYFLDRTADDNGWQALHDGDRELSLVGGQMSGLLPGIYVVDPSSNLVLHYAYEQGGKPVLEDMKRLLKASQVG